MDVFVRAADGEVGVGPREVDNAKAVVSIEEDKGVVCMSVGDNVF